MINNKTKILRRVWSVLLCSLISFLAEAQTSFELNVLIEDLFVPARLTLTTRSDGQWVESIVESNNGSFLVKGSVNEPSFAFLVLKLAKDIDLPPEPGNVLYLFIENKPLTIKSKSSLKEASMSGSVSQSELNELRQSIGLFTSEQRNEREESVKKFISKHPNSFVSIYALQDFSMDGSFTMDAQKVAPLFDLLSKNLLKTSSGRSLQQDIQISQRTALGSQAPDFSQFDTLQKDVNLKSFLGKYVLIDFWASWCRPCREENPELVKTYHEFKNKNFTIISVSLDRSRANWIKAIKKDHLEWTHTSDLKFWRNEVALLYGVKSIPQNFIIDPRGKIIGKNIPPKDLSHWLNENIH